jgi:hypothetical protein
MKILGSRERPGAGLAAAAAAAWSLMTARSGAAEEERDSENRPMVVPVLRLAIAGPALPLEAGPAAAR